MTCSRTENRELFGLAIGGSGLFGIITRVQLRLRHRVKVRRVVDLAETAGISDRFEERIGEGYLYGDYQFTTDATADSFLRRGVFSCYQPVSRILAFLALKRKHDPDEVFQSTWYRHILEMFGKDRVG